MLHRRKTVYERSLENGGYMAGPNHPLTKSLEFNGRLKESEEKREPFFGTKRGKHPEEGR